MTIFVEISGELEWHEQKNQSWYGNFSTRSFADYHVPLNLDVMQLGTILINEVDQILKMA